ncbi:MAG: CinA family protein [Moraxellaceae bacterium]|nr:CinA family protein [Pseudobdellovibrionaceae bacterium]
MASFYSLIELQKCVAQSIQVLRDNQATVGFAESCTGGLLSSSFAKVSGVSDVFMGSLVSYANYVKADILGVKDETLEKFGAVSAECAKEMSEQALILFKVSYAVAITGIAGPKGGSTEKPVGTVFISVSGISDAHENEQENEKINEDSAITTLIFHHDFNALNSREEIQLAAAVAANQDLHHFIKVQN